METPICVFDAQAFVDHIHEIKTWIDDGRLRIVVSTSTFDNVEQLYKKSIEPKPTGQEPSKPRPVGKAARKVYPAFDLNPRIAKEFLARIQAGENGEVYVKDRPVYEKEEKWGAVQFQTPKEEYTPWKDAPVEEEKVEVVDDRPLSWAELAKKKLNQTNGITEESRVSRGPAKPKLVSKASGNDLSPWKMQKNAPKIPANEVPGHLRPLMSCALWRLHESIDRNDSNQIFLLSDQHSVGIIANKLNITVRSMKDLREKIAASIPKVDLNVWGLLEMEGLAKPKDDLQNGSKFGAGLLEASASDDGAKKPEVVKTEDLVSEADQAVQNGTINGSHNDQPQIAGEEQAQDTKNAGIHASAETSVVVREESELPPVAIAKIGLDPEDLVQSILDASAIQARHAIEDQEMRDGMHTPQLQPPADIVEASGHQTQEEVQEEARPPPGPVVNVQKPTAFDAQESPEDSDEEVVVFVPNPKRMSAQKKAAQSNSRPSTAHGQSPSGPLQDPSTPTGSKFQVVSKMNTQPPSRNPGSVGHGHSRPLSSGPTVIDPDAFGRGFAVNPDSSPHGNARRPRSRQSPRASMQYTNASFNGSTGSTQEPIHTSPRRHTPGRSPRPNPRAPQQKEASPPAEVPVISHQAFTRAPLVAPNTQANQQSRFGPIGPPKSGTTASPAVSVKDPDFVRDANIQRPRSANGPSSANVASLPHRRSPRPRPNPLNDYGTSTQGGHQEQKSSRPSLFEPELDRTNAQLDDGFEPRRTHMPDVQYTLKSGRPRETARGKGKLWVG